MSKKAAHLLEIANKYSQFIKDETSENVVCFLRFKHFSLDYCTFKDYCYQITWIDVCEVLDQRTNDVKAVEKFRSRSFKNLKSALAFMGIS